jgi:copper oxidase (laccase) domain-containing protein
MENLGADRTCIRAAIGPCIAQASYQVGEEFPVPFLAANPLASAFFAPDFDPGKYRFDLRGFVASRLEQVGIADTEALPNDTYEEEEAFFSYRRTCHRGEGDYGRGLSAIALADTD